jgi:hypothetical protein
MKRKEKWKIGSRADRLEEVKRKEEMKKERERGIGNKEKRPKKVKERRK